MVFVIPGVLALSFFSLFFCCMMPETGRMGRMRVFERQYIAHRGFHDNEAGYPENSMAAFRRAMEMGYGIELDVQLTADKIPVVFHDWDLKRAAGVDRRVDSFTYEELKKYPLFGSGEHIPLFSDVLDMVGGRVPLIIELKAERKHRRLCEETAVLLDNYRGPYCIESFSPLALGWFRRFRPGVIRGQLATNHRREGLNTPWYLEGILTNCMLNGFARPDFIAYNCQFSNTFPVTVLRHFYKCEMAAWTIRSQKELEKHRKQFDVFIFDSFRPDEKERDSL